MNGKKLTAEQRQERNTRWWQHKAETAPDGHARALAEWDWIRSVIAGLPAEQQDPAWAVLAAQIKLARRQVGAPGVSTQPPQHAQARVRARDAERTTNRKEGE